MKPCKYCDSEISSKKLRKKAIFCSDTCRFSFHNEVKRFVKNMKNSRVKETKEEVYEKIEEYY
tara:strand:- start:1409 stop:1597 length:189 start_codon:yes stop_codon:yes gene_type:complete